MGWSAHRERKRWNGTVEGSTQGWGGIVCTRRPATGLGRARDGGPPLPFPSPVPLPPIPFHPMDPLRGLGNLKIYCPSRAGSDGMGDSSGTPVQQLRAMRTLQSTISGFTGGRSRGVLLMVVSPCACCSDRKSPPWVNKVVRDGSDGVSY